MLFESELKLYFKIFIENSKGDEIHGVSQKSVANHPFRKNAAFSKPMNEYKNENLPHNIPK